MSEGKASKSVRIHAVAVLICVSETQGGRLCGTVGRFENPEPEGALDDARAAGWAFRLRAARCPACGRAGNSFGKGA